MNRAKFGGWMVKKGFVKLEPFLVVEKKKKKKKKVSLCNGTSSEAIVCCSYTQQN